MGPRHYYYTRWGNIEKFSYRDPARRFDNKLDFRRWCVHFSTRCEKFPLGEKFRSRVYATKSSTRLGENFSFVCIRMRLDIYRNWNRGLNSWLCPKMSIFWRSNTLNSCYARACYSRACYSWECYSRTCYSRTQLMYNRGQSCRCRCFCRSEQDGGRDVS